MQARMDEFLSTFQREVAETFTTEDGLIAAEQLRKTLYVATNDHHGPMNAFDAFNAHLTLSLASATGKIEPLKAIIVLSCCNVSLNNVSFPRGLLYSVARPEVIGTQRMSLLRFEHGHSLYGYRPYGQKEVLSMRQHLTETIRSGEVSTGTGKKLAHLLETLLADPAITQRKTYAAQASIINRRLWELVFEGRDVPRMIEVTQERLVAKLLIEHHLGRDTMLHRCLFSQEFERKIVEHFDGMYGAFSLREKMGTYLFWGRQKAGQRVRMTRVGDFLTSEDDSVRIAWTPEAVAQALQERRIIPGLLLVFWVLSFYYGLKCLGGYSQVNYLTYMKEASMKMLKELGDTEAAESLVPVGTKHWSGFTLTYIRHPNGLIAPAQFLDLYLYGKTDTWDWLTKYADTLSLQDAVGPLLPEIYRYSYQEHEREADLMALTSDGIAAATGIKPCLTLS